jgi:hypothetical protein
VKMIWKYPIVGSLSIPWGYEHKVVHVAIDPASEDLAVWVMFDPDIEAGLHYVNRIQMTVEVFGTGHRIPDGFEHLGTVRQGPFMWHVCGIITL